MINQIQKSNVDIQKENVNTQSPKNSKAEVSSSLRKGKTFPSFLPTRDFLEKEFSSIKGNRCSMCGRKMLFCEKLF